MFTLAQDILLLYIYIWYALSANISNIGQMAISDLYTTPNGSANAKVDCNSMGPD